MAYVEDVAASFAASWADSFSSQTNINFGSKNFNFGGSQTLKTDATQGQDSATTSDARAVASTAKAGDGGVASSSASLAELAASAGIDWKGALIAMLGALGLGFVALTFLKKKPVVQPKPAAKKKK